MKLKHQLLAISVVLLLLPWSGYRLVSELESALRANQQRVLSQTATLLERRLQSESALMDALVRQADSPLTGLYAHPLSAPPIVDGYLDEWHELGRVPVMLSTGAGTENAVQLTLGVHGERLHLFFRVTDDRVVYHDPGHRHATADEASAADSLWVTLHDRSLVFKPVAPGVLMPHMLLSGRFRPGMQTEISAYWQETATGYDLELTLPLSWVQEGIRFEVLQGTGMPQALFDTLDYRIVHRDRTLEALLAEYVPDAGSLALMEPAGWIVGRTTEESSEPGLTESGGAGEGSITQVFSDLLVSVLRWAVLAPDTVENPEINEASDRSALVQSAFAGSVASGWFTAADGRYALSSVAQPVYWQTRPAFVLRVDQHTRTYAALSNDTIADVLLTSLGGYVVVTALLLGYAGLLSYRIRALNRHIGQAVSEDGRVQGGFTPARTPDELGDLSRSFHQMVQALNGYTAYLETFASKLAHEIKTPVAIVRSSLDNLDEHNLPDDQAVYMARARDGCTRIVTILDALRSASRLERAVEQMEPEAFSLAGLVRALVDSYAQTLPVHRVQLIINGVEPNSFPMHGGPDLIAQMMDKLIDNAKDFTPQGQRIVVTLSESTASKSRPAGYLLAVANEGPSLPDALAGDIFSSFISLREGATDGHFGLGLVIVRLIVERHGGHIRARNISSVSDGFNGVKFSIFLPRTCPAPRASRPA